MDNSKEAKQLDLEYRQILKVIKPFVQTITNSAHLAQYRIWLEKLSTIEDAKQLRNQYLLELARQIQSRMLAPPFERNPPMGKLTPLEGSGEGSKKVESKIKQRSSSLCINRSRNESIASVKSECSTPRFGGSGDIKKYQKTDDQEETEENDETSNFLVKDWKTVVENLELRLSETQNQNKELRYLTSTLHKKIKEMDATKEQVLKGIRKEFDEKNHKNIKDITKKHKETMEEIIKAQKEEIKQLTEKFNQRKQETELKYLKEVNDLKKQHAEDIDAKNVTIARLERKIDEECNKLLKQIIDLRLQINETNNGETDGDEKIQFLQRCITKMDRLFRKSETEYSKEVDRLRHELENREKTFQIQLQTQKAEIVARCSSEKQKEMDAIVKTLEVKYLRLLEMQADEMLQAKSDDEAMS